MSSAAFDTLAAARALEASGLSGAQAEAVIETVRSAVVEGVATKSDIADLRTDMTSDIADLRTDMAKLETRMTRTLYAVAGALLAGQLAAVFALLRLLG